MMAAQLGLDFASGTAAPSRRGVTQRRPEAPTSPDERAARFHEANPHVFAELLALARAELDRGEEYIEVNRLFAELRHRRTPTTGDPYRLNHSYRAFYSRALIAHEPRFDGVIKIRARKCDRP